MVDKLAVSLILCLMLSSCDSSPRMTDWWYDQQWETEKPEDKK